jgi:hypothetical protein
MNQASSTTVSTYGSAWNTCTGTSPMPDTLQANCHSLQQAEQQACEQRADRGHVPKIIAGEHDGRAGRPTSNIGLDDPDMVAVRRMVQAL